jgi:hypothetical protein
MNATSTSPSSTRSTARPPRSRATSESGPAYMRGMPSSMWRSALSRHRHPRDT